MLCDRNLGGIDSFCFFISHDGLARNALLILQNPASRVGNVPGSGFYFRCARFRAKMGREKIGR